jgi:hypothetical protein
MADGRTWHMAGTGATMIHDDKDKDNGNDD